MAKFKLFDIFSKSTNKHDKGLTKEEAEFNGKYNLVNFFWFYKNRFSDLVKANLIFTLCCFPLFFMLFPLTGNFNIEAQTPTNMLYPLVLGMQQYDTGATVTALNGVFAGETVISVWSNVSRVFYCLGFLTVLTFGFACTGLAYITRGCVRRQHLDIWHDFFTAIKRNFKQAFFMGLLDFGICFTLVFDILSYNVNRTNYWFTVSYYLIIVIAVFYFVMRFYIYLIMITFDLSMYKIIKNAFIFSILGFKRNICAIVGILITVLLSFYAFILLQTVGLMLPFFLTIGLLAFLCAYCAYPIICKYMIEPYHNEKHGNDQNSSDNIEPVFKDRG